MHKINDSSDNVYERCGEMDDECATYSDVKSYGSQRICLVGTLGQDPSVCEAAANFNVPVVASDTGQEYVNEDVVTYFVLEEFQGSCFDLLSELKCRILGPTALKEMHKNKELLPPPDRLRPIYSFSMKGLIICFTGFRKKSELFHLAKLIHMMGGSIRRDMESKVTHLVAQCTHGEKYTIASTFNIPIMAESWVITAWENRHISGYSCKNPEIIASHKLKFGGTRVCFLGFSNEETEHMTQILLSNGGIASAMDDPHCNYLVVDESNILTLPETMPSKAHVVKTEWFWMSVQNEYCEYVKEYLFEDNMENILSPDKKRLQSTPLSGNASTRARKRKRLQQKSSLNQLDSPLSHKRRSSISDAGLLSISGSLLECTATPEKDLHEDVKSGSSSSKNVTARHQIFLELVQTEANYVSILKTIMSLFKTPLEEMAEGENMLLNATEVNLIFGNIPLIYEIHSSMLQDLQWGDENWTEGFSVGNVISKYIPQLLKAYPPYSNYLEKSKETLDQCDSAKPRFHAFLKARQTKPECGRQSLKDLLTCPVQRLPRIVLLLESMLKRTDKQDPDQKALEDAMSGIKEVLALMNENKRKTEAQLAMFELFNEIEDCPAHLVSSHRSLVTKCECVELTDVLSCKKGDALVLFLFTDTLEVCKKRARTFNTFRNTKPSSLHKSNKVKKHYKHIKLMPLFNIRKVVDIKESGDCQNMFALLCRNNQSLKETSCSFSITDESLAKREFLQQMCTQIANAMCTPDPEDFYDIMDASEVNTESASNVSIKSTHSFSKALRFASRTGVRVSRALSMSKTPNKLTRAASTIRTSKQTSLTPSATQLAQMRLHSCANLSDLHCTPSKDSPLPPMSVQPSRRNMLASAFSVSSLKLL